MRLDDEAVAGISAHLTGVARAEGMPEGRPLEYDVTHYRQQVPGGMISTLQRQLAEIRMERRLPEVLEEIPRVRADLGYPIMVTPFSQFIGSQAVMNVATGEGYKNVPDQVIKFVQGDFGEPPAEIDPDVKDRILDRGRARKLAQRDRRNRSTSGAPRSGRTGSRAS